MHLIAELVCLMQVCDKTDQCFVFALCKCGALLLFDRGALEGAFEPNLGTISHSMPGCWSAGDGLPFTEPRAEVLMQEC